MEILSAISSKTMGILPAIFSKPLSLAGRHTDRETTGADDGRKKTPPLRTVYSISRSAVNGPSSLEGIRRALDQLMEALADPNTYIVGLHSSDENAIKMTGTLPSRVIRRVQLGNMFDVIVAVNVTKKPDIKKIQEKIAAKLDLRLDEKSETERANILRENIRMKQKIIIVICELYKAIDLTKVGIPYGAGQGGHSGCKILLTSTNQDVLSNQMDTQKNFSADSLIYAQNRPRT